MEKLTSWDEFEKTIFTPEEIAESDLRVALIGELIKARDEQGISQKELEKLSGVKQPSIARLEKLHTDPRLHTLIKLLVPLGKTLAIVPLDRVIVAAGGLAGRQLGGSDAGYELLASLGHRCTKLYPSLVQLRTDPTWVRSCKGVRAQAAATLLQGENVLAQETGEVQFTDFGVSGPCIFSLARYCAGRRGMLAVVLDLCPCLDEGEIIDHLTARRERFPELTLENYLTGLLHNRLGRTVLRERKLALTQTAASLTKNDIARIAAGIKAFRIDVLGPMDLSQAQVTAGGMKTSEFDPVTLESRLVPGLYATGEVLDVDGDCGGFNLQWAWSSGWTAGLTLHREAEA